MFQKQHIIYKLITIILYMLSLKKQQQNPPIYIYNL